MDPPIRQLTILAGPRFNVLHAELADVTIHTLFGTALIGRGYEQNPFGKPPYDTNAFAASFGGSFDLNLEPRVALRLVEPSLFLCAGRPECFREKSFRIASGLIFRLVER